MDACRGTVRRDQRVDITEDGSLKLIERVARRPIMKSENALIAESRSAADRNVLLPFVDAAVQDCHAKDDEFSALGIQAALGPERVREAQVAATMPGLLPMAAKMFAGSPLGPVGSRS